MKISAWILSTALAVPMTMTAQNSKIAKNMVRNTNNNSSQLAQKDKLFLHTLASEDQAEINLAHLALQKSSNPQIQNYAKTKILAADPEMKAGAEDLAQRKNTSISGQPSAAAKERYKVMARLSGKKFEKAYAKYEARKQSADLKVVKFEANSAKSSQVRSYAQREETPVQMAAQSAKKLAHSLNVKMPS